MPAARGDNRHTALDAWVRALERTAPISASSTVILPGVIDSVADRFGPAPALVSEGQCLSYSALVERSNRYARWALRQGLGAGDVICLLMPNCPDYLAIWLGVTRVGAIVALVNTNLVGDQLAHSINIVTPKHLIVAAELADRLAAIRTKLYPGLACWAHGEDSHGLPRVDHEIRQDSGDRLDGSEHRAPSIKDPALYIYTSGTTGLPKAARVSHYRLMQWSHWFAGMMDTRPSDRMYHCLPMYHSIGGVVATGAVLVSGGSVVLRQRFSASRFWDDVNQCGCTLFQYIGELCRYLVNSPPDPQETSHRLRLCCGNGLRPDVWREFQRRFQIPQILEFYAATEGSFSLYNCEGMPGAIGRVPSFLAHRVPVALIRSDDSGEPVRDQRGFCIRCAPDEAGEAIGKIDDDGGDAAGRFEGYTDEAATGRKILRHVFKKGDAWYRSGDLMRKDRRGFFYFVDRIGDTFRWKGENVSTTEVADAIAAFPAVIEATVYGVSVPGTEGRAGMAALEVGNGFDLMAFRRHLAERLPEYAQPLFLRFRTSLEMTGTFKTKKQELCREGYDPGATPDAVYFNDRARSRFVKLDAELYARIQSGDLRL